MRKTLVWPTYQPSPTWPSAAAPISLQRNASSPHAREKRRCCCRNGYGRPAHRLTARLGLTASRDTILRALKRAPQPAATPLKVVGIDDWSWRKGSTYGTLFMDLERRQVIDLLPDRKAATTARWLAAHPEIEVISRDRCGLYAVGAAQGAPQARQVADRFHLLQNLRDVIERQLSRGPAKIVTRPVPGGAKVRIDRFRIKGLRNFRPRYPSRSIQRPGI